MSCSRNIKGALETACQNDPDAERVQAPRDQVRYAGLVIDNQDLFHTIGPRIDSTFRVSAIGENGLVK